MFSHAGHPIAFAVARLAVAGGWLATNLAAQTAVAVDWPTRTAGCPATITKSGTQQFTVSNVNDIAFDFKTGLSPLYRLTVHGTPVSTTPPADVLGLIIGTTQSKALARAACPIHDNFDTYLTHVRSTVPTVPATETGTNTATSLEESLQQAAAIVASSPELRSLGVALNDPDCVEEVKSHSSDPILSWLARFQSGDHSRAFTVSVNPNTNYKFDLSESFGGHVLEDATLTWRCGETDILTLSVGPMYSTLPIRTYVSQTVPVAGTTTTQNVLAVNASSNILGAALLNYHLPQIPGLPEWTGLSISIGPVYTLGNAPTVSKLGFFSGVSAHLYRSLYITPGVHVGQFADYPTGFSDGSIIPSGFGTLTPITRNTARFAIGVTFKTTSLKTSQGSAPSGQSSPTNPAPATAAPASTAPAVTNPAPATPEPVSPSTDNPTTDNQPSPNPNAVVSNVTQTQPSSNQQLVHKAKWTILVFLNAKNTLEQDAFINYDQMAKVGSTQDVKVVVELGRPLNHHYRGDPLPWSGVKRFLVTKGVNTPEAAVALSDLGPADMGTGKTLKDFVTWGVSAYPADNYMLVIWDHGQGYRLQLTSLRATRAIFGTRNAIQVMNGPSSSQIPPAVGGVKSVSYDEDTNHILYNRDIEDSLKTSLNGNKLQVLSFDACLMSMIETAYAMRDVSSFFVGSEEEEPGNGWNYERFLSALVANPGYTPAQVSTLVVSSYAAEYGSSPLQTTMAAFDQGKVVAVANAISAFAAAIQPLLQTNFMAFKQARAGVNSYGASSPTKVSVDLMLFTSRLATAYGVPNLTDKAQKIQDLLSTAILKAYASQSIITNYGSNGIAIFFPQSAADFDNDPDSSGYDRANTLFPIEFVNDEDWSLLVQKFVSMDRAAVTH